MSFFKNIASRIFASTSSVDAAWQVASNTRLLSAEGEDGHLAFFTDEKTARAFVGSCRGYSDDFVRYDIFAPDEIVRKVSGSVSSPKKGNKTLVAYTDGSFVQKGANHVAGYGVFCCCGDAAAEYANTVLDNAMTFGSMGGEFAGAVVAIKVAVANGYEKVEIHHDFDGVATFSEKSCSSPNRGSKMYWLYDQYKAFLDCVSDKIEIEFVKVKAHALDVGNEHANFLASTYAKRHAASIKGKRLAPSKKQCSAQNRGTALPDCVPVVPSDFVPVFRPKRGEEKSQKEITNGAIKNYAKSLGLGKRIGCLEAEYSFVSSDLAEVLRLSDDEATYVRYLLSGARGHKTMSNRMGMPTKKVARLHSCCAAKFGMKEGHADEYEIVRRAMSHMYTDAKLPHVTEEDAKEISEKGKKIDREKVAAKQRKHAEKQHQSRQRLAELGLVPPSKDASDEEKARFNEEVRKVLKGQC